jgi:hypothetical protein
MEPNCIKRCYPSGNFPYTFSAKIFPAGTILRRSFRFLFWALLLDYIDRGMTVLALKVDTDYILDNIRFPSILQSGSSET